MRDGTPLALAGDFDVNRKVGSVNGIAVEVWSASERGRAVLVVYPSVHGFTVISSGALSDIDMLVSLGGCILHALSGVTPLLTGSLFRDGRAIVDAPSSDLRQ